MRKVEGDGWVGSDKLVELKRERDVVSGLMVRGWARGQVPLHWRCCGSDSHLEGLRH